MSKNVLAKFRPQVAGWFEDVFAGPTPVQEHAWDAISGGANALVVAPTGSGKTLAAFLWSLRNRQYEDPKGDAARILSSEWDDKPKP